MPFVLGSATGDQYFSYTVTDAKSGKIVPVFSPSEAGASRFETFEAASTALVALQLQHSAVFDQFVATELGS